MSTSSNVPLIQFTPAGLVLPEDADILAGVQADMNDAFGGNLNPALNTPQGQLASSQAAIISDTNAAFAQFVSLVDPATSSGFMQDAIARLYFLTRDPAVPTVVQGVCIGAVGTAIPIGTLITDSAGNLYASTLAATIPSGGSITITFANVKTGPIACPANSVSMYQAIAGWDAVSNPADGVIGADVESAQAFEYRRRQSVALNAHGSLPSIYAAVFAVPNVIDVFAVENNTSSVVNYGATAYPLAPHSLYVAVSGGAAQDIGNAIWLKKDLGCDTNGSTSVTVVDPSYSYPQPTYTINYNVPTNTSIKVAVQLQNNPLLPANIIPLTKAAIIAAFSGADGGQRARIGSELFASRFYAGIASISPNVAIISVLIGTSSPTAPTLQLGIDQAPTISAADISVSLV